MSAIPLISVIIPVYNLENYITNTVKSVLNQTEQNFEIIIIDDGSTDNSLSIINLLKKNDSRIRVYHQENGGQAQARNTGIDRAKGRFITFVDGDDLIKDNYLKVMLKPLLNDEDLDLVALPHKNLSIKDRPNLNSSSDSNESLKLGSGDYLIRALKFNNNLYNVSFDSKMYASRLFKNFRIPEGHFYEDLAGLPDLLKEVNKVLWIDDEQYIYLNDRPSSTVNSIDTIKAKDIVWALEHLSKSLKNTDSLVKRALQITIVNNIYVAYSPLKSDKEYLRQMDKLLKDISIKYIFCSIKEVHISKKGLFLLIVRKIKNVM